MLWLHEWMLSGDAPRRYFMCACRDKTNHSVFQAAVEMCNSVDSCDADDWSQTYSCWGPKPALMSDASAGGERCGYSYADSGVSARCKSSRKKNNNNKLKHGTGVTSRAAKPRSCVDNNPAAPLTATLALMTGFVSPWHRCASAAAPSKWRISVRTHWLVENKRSPFTGKLHWGTCLRLHTDILISSYASAGVITMVGWLALNALMLQMCMLAMFTSGHTHYSIQLWLEAICKASAGGRLHDYGFKILK